MIDTYIKDQVEKQYLFEAITNIDVVREKAQWAIKWMDNKRTFHERLVAFAAV